MSLKITTLLLFLLFSAGKTYSQGAEPAYYITVNSNLYLPVNNPAKGVYPILWYDKETTPKLLIGGFGVGFAGLKPLNNKLSLKGQANISKHAYWDEAFYMIDANGFAGQKFSAGSADYALGLTATAHYFLGKRISLGAGLGSQVQLITFSRLPTYDDREASVSVQQQYKRFMPTLPLELTLQSKKHLYNIRYEYGLLNRYKSTIAAYKKDKYSLLSFEIGFKL